MAYEVPTATDLKAFLPEFSAVEDSTIDDMLTQAARMVDESWSEADYKTARMYYAGHLLILRGFGDSKGSKIANLALSGLSSIKVSTLGIGFQKNASGSGKFRVSPLSSTQYGQEFLGLLRRNKPAVAVIDGSS